MQMAKNKLTLVVLAAGIGSRYGGLKQLETVGPYQELLIDYSFYDAWCSGFSKIVCVIRREIEQAFCEKISNRWKKFIDIDHVYQEFPQENQTPGRNKPWGTAHAILVAKDVVKKGDNVIFLPMLISSDEELNSTLFNERFNIIIVNFINNQDVIISGNNEFGSTMNISVNSDIYNTVSLILSSDSECRLDIDINLL